jgi:protein-disulfide isomerase
MSNQHFFWALAGVAAVILIAFGAYWLSADDAPANNDLAGILTVPVSVQDWRQGAANPTVLIVEYSDFECPACASYHPLLSQLIKDYPDQVALVYRHFPLRQHLSAGLAARYTEAAGRQGRFWEMHDQLFTNQTTWAGKSVAKNEELFRDYARALGLDLNQLAADLADPSLQAKIEADYQSGLQADVDSTPSFFVNGRRIRNPRRFEEFVDLITSASTTTSSAD